MSVPVEAPSYDADPWGYVDCDANVDETAAVSSANKSCSCDVAVVVDGTWIPSPYVQTTVATNGVSDIVRLTEVHFPNEWEQQSVISHISQYGEGGDMSSVRVYYRERNTGQWFLEHVGWVRGLGGTQQTGVSKMWVDDYGSLFTAIPFSNSYSRPSMSVVLRDVRDELESQTELSGVETQALDRLVFRELQTEFSVSADIPDSERELIETTDGLWWSLLDIDVSGVDEDFSRIADSALSANIYNPIGVLEKAKLYKSFEANRNTIGDVMNWVTSTENARWWVEPTEDHGIAIVVQDTIKPEWFLDSHIGVSDFTVPLEVIENDALEEISPQTAVRVNGSSEVSVAGFGVKNYFSPSYPFSVAIYEPLVERTGRTLTGTFIDSDSSTLDEVENESKSELMRALEGNGQGDIITYGRPDILLGDRITSVPSCEGAETNTEVPPLDYRTLKVEHTYENGVYTTRLNVSVWVDRNQITIDESGMAES